MADPINLDAVTAAGATFVGASVKSIVPAAKGKDVVPVTRRISLTLHRRRRGDR